MYHINECRGSEDTGSQTIKSNYSWCKSKVPPEIHIQTFIQYTKMSKTNKCIQGRSFLLWVHSCERSLYLGHECVGTMLPHHKPILMSVFRDLPKI